MKSNFQLFLLFNMSTKNRFHFLNATNMIHCLLTLKEFLHRTYYLVKTTIILFLVFNCKSELNSDSKRLVLAYGKIIHYGRLIKKKIKNR